MYIPHMQRVLNRNFVSSLYDTLQITPELRVLDLPNYGII